MLPVRWRRAVGQLEVGHVRDRHAVEPGDLRFDLADAGQVFVELPPVGGVEPAAEAAGFLGHEIEDRPPTLAAGREALAPLDAPASPEQAFEHEPWVGFRRCRLALAPPRHVEGVGARVTGVAGSALAGGIAGELQRRKPRLTADRLGRELIDGDPDADVGAGCLSRPHAGEDRGRRPGVIPGAVGACGAVAMGQAAHDLEMILHVGEWFERGPERVPAAVTQGTPAVDMDPVGHVDERHPRGGGRPLGGAGRAEGCQRRQGDGRTHAPQCRVGKESPPGEAGAKQLGIYGSRHGSCSSTTAGRCIRNGTLSQTPCTSVPSPPPSWLSRSTILSTAGPSKYSRPRPRA